MAQGLRPSQFVTTFGPGAIVETPDGPHILMSTNDALRRIDRRIDIEDLAIRDIRLQKGLLSGARIFKVPDSTNWEHFSYPTKRFPTWNLCVHHQNYNVIHRNDSPCPHCEPGKPQRDSRSAKNAIRFLVACPNGHLDDVPWPILIHSGKGGPSGNGGPRCRNMVFHWLGSGSSLASIKIKCTACGAEKELGEIYSYKLKCQGRSPERETGGRFIRTDCPSEEAIVVQRGSFQLRLPEVVTSLTIPPLVTSLHRVLQRDIVLDVVRTLQASGVFFEESFKRAVRKHAEDGRLPTPIAEQLEKCSFSDIESALTDIETSAMTRTPSEFLSQEHSSLTDVVETGFPPYPPDNEKKPGEKVSFQVEFDDIRKDVKGPFGNLVFRVMPIERLRVVMVQKGFRRVKYTGKEAVLTSNEGSFEANPQEKWLPGVELFGEGIYLDLNPETAGQSAWYPKGASVVEWDREVPSGTGPNDLLKWNALSVWWHSLSHRLINAMALHSGYSSTAIRERVYLSEEDGVMRGGVLLYTTQAGGDGTMGGLTSLVHDFGHIFELALSGVDRCSNDPICENAAIDETSKLGAACYSCEIVSETSCEHYNGYLNRRLLLDNLP